MESAEPIPEFLPFGMGLIRSALLKLTEELLLLLSQVGGGFYDHRNKLIPPGAAVEIGNALAPETDGGSCLGAFANGKGNLAVNGGNFDFRA